MIKAIRGRPFHTRAPPSPPVVGSPHTRPAVRFAGHEQAVGVNLDRIRDRVVAGQLPGHRRDGRLRGVSPGHARDDANEDGPGSWQIGEPGLFDAPMGGAALHPKTDCKREELA
jgi:hypothetical protein